MSAKRTSGLLPISGDLPTMTITELRSLNAAHFFCIPNATAITVDGGREPFPVAVLMPHNVWLSMQAVIGRAKEIVDEFPGLREAIEVLAKAEGRS